MLCLRDIGFARAVQNSLRPNGAVRTRIVTNTCDFGMNGLSFRFTAMIRHRDLLSLFQNKLGQDS